MRLIDIGTLAVADRVQIGDEIAPVLRREAEIEDAVEMGDDLIVAVEAAVMEIGRVVVGIEERRRLEQSARADIVLLVIEIGAATARGRSAQLRLGSCGNGLLNSA